MIEDLVALEHAAIDRHGAQGLEKQGRHETARAVGEGDGNVDVQGVQGAQQLQRLVAGDGAAHAQMQTLAREATAVVEGRRAHSRRSCRPLPLLPPEK